MSKRFAGTAIAVTALAFGGSAPAHAASPKCTARNAQTILQTSSARIFSTPLGDTARRVYACLYSRNRRHLLGIDGDCDPGAAVGRLTVSGRYVGYVETNCNIDQSEDSVVVKDLRTGRNKWRAAAATGQEGNDPVSTLVTDLALASNGSVAWIADWDANSGDSAPDPNNNRQVRKLDAGAPEGGTLLDSGLDLEPRSLGLSARSSNGAWMYWTKAGSPFAARLN